MTGVERGKAPHNVGVLHRWIGQEADAIGVARQRLQRWVSCMVVSAALDRSRDEHDDPVFVLKGGVAMELRMGLNARATKDYDAAYRESGGDMLDRLDEAIRLPYGDFTITRNEAREIGQTVALQLDLKLSYRTRSWGKVRLELSATEGKVGLEFERIPAISLHPFGLLGPKFIPCIAVRYQIAQKLHACTEHFTDGRSNDRFRDLIDLLMLGQLIGDQDLPSLRSACSEVFELRAKHQWPPTITVIPSWVNQYTALAQSTGFEITDVNEAAAGVQQMVARIESS